MRSLWTLWHGDAKLSASSVLCFAAVGAAVSGATLMFASPAAQAVTVVYGATHRVLCRYSRSRKLRESLWLALVPLEGTPTQELDPRAPSRLLPLFGMPPIRNAARMLCLDESSRSQVNANPNAKAKDKPQSSH